MEWHLAESFLPPNFNSYNTHTGTLGGAYPGPTPALSSSLDTPGFQILENTLPVGIFELWYVSKTLIFIIAIVVIVVVIIIIIIISNSS